MVESILLHMKRSNLFWKVAQPRQDQRRFLFHPKNVDTVSSKPVENSSKESVENPPSIGFDVGDDGDKHVDEEPKPKVARLGSASDFFPFGGPGPGQYTVITWKPDEQNSKLIQNLVNLVPEFEWHL